MNHQDVLAQAVKVLTTVINVNAGLSHPLDQSRAKELLRELQKEGIPTPYNEVYDLLIENGWPERHAKSFADLADGVNNGKSVRVSHPRGWGEITLRRILAGESD